MLLHFGITPYLVFDGDYLPSKAKTEKERASRRKESRKLGLELLKMGKAAQAQQELQKAVDVTPEMAGLLIEELKRADLPYVVAPYEADSQLAYLEKKGDVQAVISEDSDLLVFGVRVLLTKLDQYGECIMIRRDDFTACREISLVGWSDADFRRMAILSGCDYLASIDKMGLKTAYRLIRKHKSVDKVVRSLQFDGKFKVPAGYLEDFDRAEMTFLYQWVYCPTARTLVNFSEPEKGVDPRLMPFIGRYVEAPVAQKVASGALNPHSKQCLVLPVVPTSGRAKYPLAARKENVSQQVEGEKSRSIEAFFKPRHRVPLAELDPNLFAASPTQQETLRRASGASWPATPTPVLQTVGGAQSAFTAPARRTVSEPGAWSASGGLRTTGTRTESSIIRTAMSGTPSGFGSASEFRSTKRLRLCDEGLSPVQKRDARLEEGRSKFFESPRKRKKHSAQLWSDDSLDEALMDLPDPGVLRSATRRTSKTITIFVDVDKGSRAQVSRKQDTSQSTVDTATSFTESVLEETSVTPASSLGEGDCGEAEPTTPQQVGLEEKYSYHSAARTFSRPTQSENGEEEREIASKHIVTPGSDPIEATDDELPHDDLTDRGINLQVGTATSEPVDPAPPNTAVVRGSEDFLFSESEAESIASPKVSKKVLNIARFAFMP